MGLVILAVEVGGDQVVSFLVGAVVVGGTAIGLYDKRKRELSDTYKNLYDAKKEEVAELRAELAGVKAQVDLLMSDFTRKLAEGVTDAIVRIFEEREHDK